MQFAIRWRAPSKAASPVRLPSSNTFNNNIFFKLHFINISLKSTNTNLTVRYFVLSRFTKKMHIKY